jgi:hypothetical protein
MKKQTVLKGILLMLFCAVLLSDSGCEKPKVNGCPEAALDISIAVDQSISVAPNQKQWEMNQKQWEAAMEKLCGCLKANDRIRIFAIHDNTAYSRPLFEAEMPVLPEGAGRTKTKEIRREWERIRQEANAILKAALHPKTRAQYTDILSLFKYVQPDGKRPAALVLIGDMAHSTPTLDLEMIRPSDQGFNEKLNAEISKSGWRKSMLRGVRVYCLLDSLDMNRPQPRTNRVALEQFWTEIFDFLGAKLEKFDPSASLNLEDNHAAAGGNHEATNHH